MDESKKPETTTAINPGEVIVMTIIIVSIMVLLEVLSNNYVLDGSGVASIDELRLVMQKAKLDPWAHRRLALWLEENPVPTKRQLHLFEHKVLENETVNDSEVKREAVQFVKDTPESVWHYQPQPVAMPEERTLQDMATPPKSAPEGYGPKSSGP